jgi:putative oxidoreductase
MNQIRNVSNWLMSPPTTGPNSTLLLRLMAGGVFLWEGILKFVYANQGVGRFTKLGMPFPALTANFVASLEIVGGLLLITGLLTRLIAVPFIIEMMVAILSTKISLYLGTSPLPLPPALPKVGMWAVLHEVRSEYAQIMTVAFLLVNGPGRLSLDALIHHRHSSVAVSAPAGSKAFPTALRPASSVSATKALRRGLSAVNPS